MLQSQMADLHLFSDWLIYIYRFSTISPARSGISNFYNICYLKYHFETILQKYQIHAMIQNGRYMDHFDVKYLNVYSLTTQGVPNLSCIQRLEAQCTITCIYLYVKLYFVLVVCKYGDI